MESDPLAGEHISGKRFALPEDDEHVYSVAISCDGLYVAAVFGNGVLRIMSAATLAPVARAAGGAPYADLPSTSVKWFPRQQQDGASVYRLASVSSGGALFGWEFDGETLNRVHHVEEAGNEINTVDIDKTGRQVLTAGSDRVVRLYNEKFELVAPLHEGVGQDGAMRTTHTNRVFSARFVTPTLAASAGWESPIQLWDLRTRRSDRQILCSLASSDCLEPVPNTTLLLVATGESERALQLYDSVGAVIRDAESTRLCQAFQNGERVIVARVSESHGCTWCLTISPSVVVAVSLADGRVLGRVQLPFVAMNIAVSPSRPNEAFVAGQRGNLAVLTLAV